MKLLSWLLFIFAIICFSFGGYYIWLRTDPNRLSFKNYNNITHLTINEKHLPIWITIKSAKIDLPIFPAKIINNLWQTTNDGASYLISSPIPGDKGNSIIYAHNFASLFGNLPIVKPGDEVSVQLADKSIKKFHVKSTAIVSPDDASILGPSKDSRLTLYTCAGWFDSKRFVVVAN